MLLLVPQIIITIVFFYWPASQAVWQSFLLQDAFGLSTKFVWMENYRELFHDRVLLPHDRQPRSCSPPRRGALALAARCCSPRRPTSSSGAGVYRTLLIWPYAVAPAVAGVLWAFMFQPSLGVIARGLRDISASTGIRCSTKTTP